MKMKKILSSIIAASLAFSSMSAFAAGDATAADVAKIGEEYYSSLELALADATAENVVIELLADADLEYAAREKYGAETTESITIDGNNNTLTLYQTDSDWSSIGMANADGVFKLIDLEVVKAEHKGNGAWNNHAINFTCNVDFNNVDFNNSVALQADGVLTDVNITETGEYYGLIITAEGQRVEMTGGSIVATNGGRGIKVMDQYVNSPAKVEVEVSDVTFETAEKAAILVTSTAGADITVSNIDILKCAADSQNAVWVDEDRSDYQADVTVSGADRYLEGQVAEIEGIGYASLSAAIKAAEDEDEIVLADGEYTMPSMPATKTITISGSEDVIISVGTPNMNSSNITFEGLTLQFPNDNYKGLQHAGEMTYNDVTIKGQPFLYGTSETFNNCEFIQESADAYNVWTYGAKNVTFNGCKFTSEGKSVLVYNEGACGTNLEVIDTEFIANNYVAGKAAIEVDTSLMNKKGQSTTISVDEESTATGFDAGSVSKDTLWNVKKVAGSTVVEVADEIVMAHVANSKEGTVAAAIVDGAVYATLADALAAVKDDSNVVILEGEYDGEFDISGKEGVTVLGKGDVTINGRPKLGYDFNVSGINFNYPGSEGKITGYGTLTDCEFTGYNGFRYCYAVDGDVIFKNCVITGSVYGIHFDGGEGQIIIDDCTITGWTSFGSSLEKVTISDSKFEQGNYNVLRFYQNAEVTNTQFNPESRIDTGDGGEGMEGIELVITDCTVSDGSDIMDKIPAEVISVSTVKVDDAVVGKVAKIVVDDEEVYFETLAEAIDAAVAGSEIDLMGNTAEFPQLSLNKEITISNGTISMNPAVATFAATAEEKYWLVSEDVTFENVNFVGENYSTGAASWGLFYIVDDFVTITFDNCNLNLVNDTAAGGIVKGDNVKYSFIKFIDTDAYIENTGRCFNNLYSVTLEGDSDFVIKGTDEKLENAFNKITYLKIYDTSSIEIDGCSEYGIKLGGQMLVTDNASVIVTNSGISDIMSRDDAAIDTSVTVTADAQLLADFIESGVKVNAFGKVVSKASTIYVQFEELEDEDDESITYNIVLAGDERNINRLTTADLTFKFEPTPDENCDMSYEVTAKNGLTLTNHDKDGYMFNFDGVTNPDESGELITIGQITVTGFGSFNLSVDAKAENIVNATEVVDNIVDTFIPNGGEEGLGTLVINHDMKDGIEPDTDGLVGEIKGEEISIPQNTLTINVTFPNIVDYNEADYQDMTVTIAGGQYEETIALGDTDEIAGGYSIERTLDYNTTYMVTVAGAGYRTARYSVALTEDKTLNFWNNVKDLIHEMPIEEGVTDENAMVTKNFLAGDIVKDNAINIWDLNAVVSFFGEKDIKNMSAADADKYVRYDLNRDGKIDSKDVAYVLVSWGE